MKNQGASETTYDAIVIGSGQGGQPLCTALAKAGWKTAIVERAHWGGSCINYGCTPTKTMVASARVAYLARRAADYGVQIAGPVGVDLGQVRQRKQKIVELFRSGGQQGAESTEGLELIFGEASFEGPRSVRVKKSGGGELRLRAEKIFVNTGARNLRPDLPGLDAVESLDSTSIMELEELPEHLLVLGGGYIGVEFGQMFRRFGAKVTVVQRGPQLLTREDPDVAEAVAGILREDGLEILLQTEAQAVERDAQGRVRLVVRGPAGERVLEGSHLLNAVGRVPNTDVLNLGAAGVKVDEKGYVQVNDRLETGVPGIWALGDCKGGPAFTHISYDDYRVLKTNLLDGGSASIAGRLVPYTVFMDPQLGGVGLTEVEARKRGLDVKIAKMPMEYIARALEMSEARGFLKAVVDARSGQILGATALGIEGGELMSMLQIAMLGKLHYSALKDAIFSHPTLAEGLNNLFASLEA